MSRRLPLTEIIAAVSSGLLLAVAFPTAGLSVLAWVALVPLLVSVETSPFKKSYVCGGVFFAVVLYWLNIVMTTYGGLSPALSVAVYLLLVLYLAVYFGAAVWLAQRLRSRLGWSFAVTLPVIWVGLELVRAHALTGFPWAAIGYSQQNLLMIQSAELFGVYGIGYLILLSNAVLAECVLALRRARRLPWRALSVFALLLLCNAGYGAFRLSNGLDERDTQLSIAVIQGNIEQAIKWHPDYLQASVATYRNLSLRASRNDAVDLVIWPEAATPFYFQEKSALSQSIRELTRRLDSHLLFGSPAYEQQGQERLFLNSAFLLTPQGEVAGRSDKVHLVPFGEYVPLRPLLPFVDKLVVGIGDFSPGVVASLDLNGHQLGVLVCYEGIFPELARGFVAQGSDLLVNITNDAWFGRSSAPSQHLSMVRFRAIENRVWIARAANTGISAFVAPSGRVHQPTGLFETAAIVGQVGLGARPGLYAVTGELAPILCLLLSVLWLFRVLPRRHTTVAGKSLTS